MQSAIYVFDVTLGNLGNYIQHHLQPKTAQQMLKQQLNHAFRKCMRARKAKFLLREVWHGSVVLSQLLLETLSLTAPLEARKG